jgi:dTDP-4-dehydrorhamnose 3,5-epimerase
MKFESASLSGVVIVKPRIFTDDRGWFAETFNQSEMQKNGLPRCFVQDNQSFSHVGVLRGLHYQLGKPQGKLVRVLSGEIYDVAVDLRRDSPTFGQWIGLRLSANSLEMIWIPENFAHGFLVLSESAHVLYKVTDFYEPSAERTLRWDDPTLGIDWPIVGAPVLSAKDAAGSTLQEADLP